jgi:hypothetical protein
MGTEGGKVGFHQEYNQDPGPRQDLNPDVVADARVLPKPLASRVAEKPARKPRASKK